MKKFVYVVAGLLATLSFQTQAQVAPDRAAQTQEVGAAELSAAPRAAGGGLRCFDRFVDRVLVSGERATATLACPSNSVATGGGATSSFNEGLFINATGPTSGTATDPNTWFTSAENFRSDEIAVRFYARCCRVPGL